MVEVAEAMQVVKVPSGGGALAVDFKGEKGFVSTGVAGGFEDGHGAVGEAAEECAGVVDLDWLDVAGEVVFAFFDEGLGHGGDFGDGAVEPKGHVDVVGEEIAGDAAA